MNFNPSTPSKKEFYGAKAYDLLLQKTLNPVIEGYAYDITTGKIRSIGDPPAMYVPSSDTGELKNLIE